MKDIESRLHKDLAGTLGPLPEGAETPLYTLAEIKKRAQVMREGYRAKAACLNGIASVGRSAPAAPVVVDQR